MTFVTGSGACSLAGSILTDPTGTLTSERYQEDGSGDSINHANCQWLIQAPTGQVGEGEIIGK